MLVEHSLRLMGLAIGSALHVLLVALLARQRGAGRGKWVALVALSLAGLWHVGGAVGLFRQATTGAAGEGLFRALDSAAVGGAAVAAVGALAAVWAARRAEDYRRRFLLLLAAGLAAIPAAAVTTGTGSAGFVFATLAAPACFAWFVYRHNLLGLHISRRLVFAVKVGVGFALYLLVIKRAADFIEERFDAFRELVELALLLAATLIWLPLYGWMTRFLSQRT